MKRIIKTTAIIVSIIFAVYRFSIDIYAADTGWDIENTLNVSECRQGDIVIMSVKLKGGSDAQPQQMITVEGILEYDNSLFLVEKSDILPAENVNVQACSFDPLSGVFIVKYTSELVVKDNDLILQIRLHTAKDASVGKTTLCVTGMKWNSSANQQGVELEHHIPVRITIMETEMTEKEVGDVNQDGKVNLTDAKLVMQHYNSAKMLEGQNKMNADVNNDGKINLIDAKLIMKYYNKEITVF